MFLCEVSMCDSRCAAERKNDLQMVQRCFCSMPDPAEPVDPGDDVCGGLRERGLI